MYRLVEERTFVCIKGFPGTPLNKVKRVNLGSENAREVIKDLIEATEFYKEQKPNESCRNIQGLVFNFKVTESELRDVTIKADLGDGKPVFVGTLSKMLLGYHHQEVLSNIGRPIPMTRAFKYGKKGKEELLYTNGATMFKVFEAAKELLYYYTSWEETCKEWDKK